jgi:hypothetical protein
VADVDRGCGTRTTVLPQEAEVRGEGADKRQQYAELYGQLED